MTWHRQPNDRLRAAFTLVEMLVVMTILMLLASIVLFGLSGVQEHARDRRARAQIRRIHEVLAAKWESYENRRIQLRPDRNDTPLNRLTALRELIRLELPERTTDLRGMAYMSTNLPDYLSEWPTQAKAYARYLESSQWTPQYQGAECLYLILSKTYIGDTTGLQYFTEREFGDLDNDGVPEILDAWGNPMEFLRWAPGYTSPTDTRLVSVSMLQGNDPAVVPDPLDMFRIDGVSDQATSAFFAFHPRPENNDAFGLAPASGDIPGLNSNFALFPLVASRGPDGDLNLEVFDKVAVRYDGVAEGGALLPTSPLGSQTLDNDPYAAFQGVRAGQIADPNSKGHFDNVTNHFTESP